VAVNICILSPAYISPIAHSTFSLAAFLNCTNTFVWYLVTCSKSPEIGTMFVMKLSCRVETVFAFEIITEQYLTCQH
jgi:hypothetical protein